MREAGKQGGGRGGKHKINEGMFLVGWKEVKGPHRNRVRQVENSGKAKAKKDNQKSSLPLVNKKKKGKKKDDGDTKKPKGRFKKVGYAMM